MKFPGFVGGSQALASLAANAERTVNLYPESVAGEGKASIVFRPTPGTALWLNPTVELPTSPVRGIWAGSGVLFAVAGAKLYQIFGDGSFTDIGAVGPDITDVGDDSQHSPVIILPNGGQLLIISAGYAFVHTGAALESAPVPADDTISGSLPGGQVGTATTAAFLDGYYIATKSDSKRFFISALNDGRTWDELDFETCEAYPDNIVRVLADHSELYFFGEDTTEVWRNEGSADHVFQRDPNGTIPIGASAAHSAVNLIDGPAWLGSDKQGAPIAWRGRGLIPIRVSTYAVEQAWTSTGATFADAIGYTYTEAGHTFWVLTFPTIGATWVYDFKEDLWHERAWWNGTDLAPQRGRCHAYQYGVHLVGDRTSGHIWQSDLQMLDDNAVPIHRIRTAPHLHDEVTRIFYSNFVLDIDDPDNSHDLATLEWSNDGGTTWSTPRVASTSVAQAGKFRRMTWRRLGSARDRIFRVTFTQAAPLTVIAAYLDLSKGTS